MIECGAYGERMAGYLHLAEPPIFAALGSGRSELAVTRLHTPNGFTDPTSAIPSEKAFSIHLHLRANHGGCLWLCGRLVPTGKRPSGAVTIPDFEQDPIAFFPNWKCSHQCSHASKLLIVKCMAERQGFEPWIPCGIHAFQACALSHSAISPVGDRPSESNTGRL
jgi:hypothetical protein